MIINHKVKKFGYGTHRQDFPRYSSRESRIERNSEMLARALNSKQTIAFIGSGCSAALGYPTWKQFTQDLLADTLAYLEERDPSTIPDAVIKANIRLKRRGKISAEELMFYIGACQLALDDKPGKKWYENYINEKFKPKENVNRINAKTSPHAAILKLPIHRFVTTNYDREIEEALVLLRGAKKRKMRTEGRAALNTKSFTQTKAHSHQLALFCLTHVADAKEMIFHCHGRYDEIESVIASEVDYKRWYFSETGPEFRQTLDLLFGSNAILFVGYSLGDEDLLRPLRLLLATDRRFQSSPPFFALLEEKSKGSDWDYHEYLFDRYGLNVIPYTSRTRSNLKRSKNLCAAIERIRKDWVERTDWWLQKPGVRSVRVDKTPPDIYLHYRLSSSTRPELGSDTVKKNLDDLEKALTDSPTRIVAVVGPGGTGKSWHVLKLIENMHKNSLKNRRPRDFEGFFFWSSYYTDDIMTGLDRLVAYLEASDGTNDDGEQPSNANVDLRASRTERAFEKLRKKRCLVVFDGIERLLRPTDEPGVGESYLADVTRFVNMFEDADMDSRSVLLLTSRLWPKEFTAMSKGKDPGRIRQFKLHRLRAQDIQSVEPFAEFETDEVSALCSLLQGHSYALVVARSFLAMHRTRTTRQRSFDTLCRALAATPPERRVSRMIREAIELVDQRKEHLALPFLERLAVFMSPVSKRTLEMCYDRAAAAAGSAPQDITSAKLTRTLLDACLIYQIESDSADLDKGFTVHPIVRTYVFERVHRVRRDAMPNFTLPGLTSGTAAVHPGSKESAALILDLIDALEKAAMDALDREKQTGCEDVDRIQDSGIFCRSFFGVVRSRMEANTTSRWCSFGEYIDIALRLLNLVKNTSLRHWRFRERHGLRSTERRGLPLYADELAWLYNDLGLALCCEGSMGDAYAVWEQGYEINRLVDGESPAPRHTLQSELHMAHTFLELGDLFTAEEYLDATAKTNSRVNDTDYAGRILGYRAIIKHLQGDFGKAASFFDASSELLSSAGGNARADSYFSRHRAQLEIDRGMPEVALEFLRTSRALAETGEFPDLVLHCRAGYGSLYRAQGEFGHAISEFWATLQSARDKGMYRLEAELLVELSRIALTLGDASSAHEKAIQALKIANEFCLGLRQSEGLLTLGLANLSRGRRNLGSAYLQQSLRITKQQGYWLLTRRAEQKLEELGISRH